MRGSGVEVDRIAVERSGPTMRSWACEAICPAPVGPARRAQQPDQQGLLEVEAVGRLGDDPAPRAVEDLGGHLLAAVGGQAVEEDRLGLRGRRAGRRSPGRAGRRRDAARPRAPGPCSPRRRCRRRRPRPPRAAGRARRPAACPGSAAANRVAEVGSGTRSRRGGQDELAARACAEATASDRATLLPSPTKTSLTPSRRPNASRIVSMSAIAWHGCAGVGQGVDDRDRRVLGQLLDRRVREGPHGQGVDVLADHAGEVGDALAARPCRRPCRGGRSRCRRAGRSPPRSSPGSAATASRRSGRGSGPSR